jgi:hypothetical protein
MLDWLTAVPVLPDGGVLSWSNSRHSGFRYPEAAALLLRLLTFYAPEQIALRDRLALALVSDVSLAGGIGKAGREYAFDAAMALAALVAHRQRGGQGVDSEVLARLFGFIKQCVEGKRAVVVAENRPAGCWSLSYGSHLLKLIVALRAYQAAGGPPACAEVMERLLGDQLPLWDGVRFRVSENSHLSYLHAHCYALEGLLLLGANQMRAVERSADWLCQVQTAEGGLCAWHDGEHAFGPCRADATAQAVRIWCCLDRLGYAAPITRGLRFLRELQAPSGGLRYEPANDDINTWATIFAAQASRWAREGVRLAELV